MSGQVHASSIGLADARPVERATRLRGVVALSLASSAGIHAALAPHHAEHGILSGVSFALAAVAMAVAAGVVALGRGRRSILLAVVFLAGAITVYAVSMFTPVPVVAPHVEGLSVVGVISKLVELTGLVAATWLLLSSRADEVGRRGVLASLLPVATTVLGAAYATRALGH